MNKIVSKRLIVSAIISILIAVEIFIFFLITSTIYVVKNELYYYICIATVLLFTIIWYFACYKMLFKNSKKKSLMMAFFISCPIPLLPVSAIVLGVKYTDVVLINTVVICTFATYTILSILQDKWKE
jgi:hypothetical protein